MPRVEDTDQQPGKPKILYIRMQTLKKTKTGWKVENTVEEKRPGYEDYYDD